MRIILSLFLCLSLCIPVSAAEPQSSDDGIMPLNLTSQESTYLKGIYDRLYYNNSSAAYYLYYINSRLVDGGQTIAYWVHDVSSNLRNIYQTLGILGQNGTMADNVSNIRGYLYNIQNFMQANGYSVAYWTRQIWVYLDDVLNSHLNTVKSSLSGISSGIGNSNTALGTANTTLDAILAALNEGNAKEWPTYTGQVLQLYRTDYPFHKAVVDLLQGLWSGLVSDELIPVYLHSDGGFYRDMMSSQMNFVYYLVQGFGGLSANLAGSDKRTTFSFLAEDITQPAVSQSADNILDALGIMGTQLQNPLQRLAYVFANPTDLEIRENVSENTEETNEQFFKPGSPGSVSGGNIKDAAGLTAGAGQLLTSPVSVGDALGQMTNSGNYSFFSEQTYHDLNTVNAPSTASLDVEEFLSKYEADENGFVNFYQPGNSSLFDLLGKGG